MQRWLRPTGSKPNRYLTQVGRHNGPTGPWTPYAGTGDRGRVRVAIIGAGPTGLFLGAALQRRGHAVTVVDRDGGPEADGSWPRRGVMQFHHAHAFRGPVAGALRRELPEAYARWLELGAEPVTEPGTDEVAGVRSQRSTFERALREVVAAEPGLVLRSGHVRGVRHVDGVAIGLDVDGTAVPAELVLDASGRSSRVTRDLGERAGFGGDCGLAYVDRLYRLRPAPSRARWPARSPGRATSTGTMVLVFLHEQGVFSTVIMRHGHDAELKLLRHDAAYDAACAAIPGLAAWTDPERAEPLGSVFPGGSLLNHYRGQRRTDGRPLLSGLVVGRRRGRYDDAELRPWHHPRPDAGRAAARGRRRPRRRPRRDP